jgi:hypothetical protein
MQFAPSDEPMKNASHQSTHRNVRGRQSMASRNQLRCRCSDIPRNGTDSVNRVVVPFGTNSYMCGGTFGMTYSATLVAANNAGVGVRHAGFVRFRPARSRLARQSHPPARGSSAAFTHPGGGQRSSVA